MKAEERPELPAELTGQGQGHDMGVALQMVDPRLPPLNTPVFSDRVPHMLTLTEAL